MQIDFSKAELKSVAEIRQSIESIYSSAEIFQLFLPDIVFNRKFSSPFRKDENPSFIIYKNVAGKCWFFDFTTGEKGDCYDFIQKLFSVNYVQAVKILSGQIKSIAIDNKQKIISTAIGDGSSRKVTKITVRPRKWSIIDDDYWTAGYELTEEDCKFLDIFPIEYADISSPGYNGLVTSGTKSPIYAFEARIADKSLPGGFDICYKLYQPYAEKEQWKWKNNIPATYVFGLKQMLKMKVNPVGIFEQYRKAIKHDKLIITKSLKDVGVLLKLGYYAIAPTSESAILDQSVIEFVKTTFDFSPVVLFDNDRTGLEKAKIYRERYGLSSIMIPYDHLATKDISDAMYYYGYTETSNLLRDLLTNARTI